MNYLRSVIADSRPRKPFHEPSDGLSARWKPRGIEMDASGAEERSANAPDENNPSYTSLPIREGASDFNASTATALKADNPTRQDTLGVSSDVEPERTVSVLVDTSGTIPNEQIFAHPETGCLADRESDSESTVKQLDMHETVSSNIETNLILKGETAESRFDDDRRHAECSIKAPEMLASQADTTQKNVLTSAKNNHHNESSEHETPRVPPVFSYDITENSTPSTAVVAVPLGTGGAEDLQHPGESQVDDASGTVIGQIPTSENPAVQNEAEKALAGGGKAHQISPNVDEQAHLTGLSNQEDISRLIKPDDSKGAHGDVQLVYRQVKAVASQGSSATEHASVPQSVGKKVSTSVSSPGPAPAKPGSRESHIAGPARFSANPEALRSVLAVPFQMDSMSKAGDTLRSRLPLRSAEKMHEAPKVQIGQIDVIVEAATQPATKKVPAPSPTDLASRHYLRRL